MRKIKPLKPLKQTEALPNSEEFFQNLVFCFLPLIDSGFISMAVQHSILQWTLSIWLATSRQPLIECN